MAERMQSQRPKYRRRNYLVDKPLQYSIMFTALAALVMVAFLFLGAHFVLPTEEVFDSFTGEQTRSIILTLNAAFFALTFITLGIIMVVLSHRVAGPAMVFERALRGFMKGDLSFRTTIREKDYLKSLSKVLCEFRDHLKDSSERQNSFMEELEQALTAKDVTKAQRLLKSFIESIPSPDTPEPSEEPVSEPEVSEPKTPVATGP